MHTLPTWASFVPTKAYTLFNLHCSRMNQYLITSAIENLTPWLGGYDTDTSGYIQSMKDAVWAPQGMWTRTLAVELLQDADAYYRAVMTSRLTARPGEGMPFYPNWIHNFEKAREKLEHKIDGGVGWHADQPYPPFEPEQES